MLHRITRFLALAAACTAPVAYGQLGTVYEGHLAIQSRNAGGLNVRGLPISNDVLGGELGLHPVDGPHVIARDPGFYAAHATKVTADLNESIPDKNFTGIILLDYEHWWPNWEWSSRVTPAWTNYIRTQRPDLLAGHMAQEEEGIIRNAYLAEVRKYYEFTINLCRTLRPKARVTVYGLPLGSYWIFNGGTQSGVNLARYREIHQVDLKWYFDLIDVVCPTIYQSYPVKTPPGPGQFEPTGPTNHVMGIVAEAVAAARGKPVMPFMQFRYHPSSAVGGQLMTQESLDICIRAPKLAGATGIVIWDFFYQESELNEWQNYYDNFARSTLSTTLSNGHNGGPGGTGGGDPEPTDPGTNPGGGNPEPTDPGTNPGGGNPDPTDPFGGGGPDPIDPGDGTSSGGAPQDGSNPADAASASSAGGSGGGGSGGSSGGGSSGGGSSGGGGMSMDGGGGGGSGGSTGGQAVSVTGAGLAGAGGVPAQEASSDGALLALDPKFFRTFRGGLRGKKTPFSHEELALALARAHRGQRVDGAIKNPKLKLPETAVAGVPTE